MPTRSAHSFATELILDGGLVPTRINLLPPSQFTGRDGRGPFVYEYSALATAFSANAMPIALDYDHQSESASEKSGPVPASGWITALDYDPASGVWATVDWTEDASACIAAREYRGFSPVFSVDTSTGRILEIIGGGLTNRPNLHLVLLNSRTDSYTSDTNNSSESSPVLEKLLAALGLAPDATEADATAALEALKSLADKSTALDSAVTAAGITDALEPATVVESLNARSQVVAGAYVPRADFEAMSQRATTAETELVAMRKATAEAELNSVLDAARVAGKLTPAQVAHARALGEKDLSSLKAMLDATAPVVNTSAAPAAQSTTAVATHTVKLTAEQRRQAFLMGKSDADYAASLQNQ